MGNAYLEAGAAVEIFASEAFTTPQEVVGGVVVDQATNHPPGALALYGPDDLARYLIQSFAEPTPPSGEVVVTRTLVVTGGVISASCTFGPPPVPAAITKTQAFLELASRASPTNAGKTMLDDANAFVAAATAPEVQIYWDTTDHFDRDHPELIAMAAQIGWSSSLLDDVFRAAAQRS